MQGHYYFPSFTVICRGEESEEPSLRFTYTANVKRQIQVENFLK